MEQFAECCTRQIGYLPSVFAIALGKEAIQYTWDQMFAECWVFAECPDKDTQQRLNLYRVPCSGHSAKI